jgi:hypothetical protein
MTQPTPYTPTTSFASFNPSSFPSHGIKTDAELVNLATTLDDILTNLALIQRDDGALANGIVNRDALATAVAAGVNTPTTWATATEYTERDSVVYTDAKWYWATEAHTSGVFATDLAAGYWELIFDFTTTFDTALSNATPAALGGAATAGVAVAASRADHVHDVPTVTLATDAETKTGTETTKPITPSNLSSVLWALEGKRTSTGTGAAMVAFTRYRITASVTMTLPTMAANEYLIVERDTAAGSVTVGRNSQTIDGASADFVLDRNKDVILFFCDSAGVVVTRYIGVVPT